MGKSRKYWLIAAGDALRDYSDVFLRFGVMLVGSGDSGSYFENRKAYSEIDRVRRFAEEVQPGDVVILKRGVRSIVATGIVDEREDSYFHSEVFGDVQGFSIQHGRYVTWYKPDEEVLVSGLARGTLTHTYKSHIQQFAERIIHENTALTSDEIPSPAENVDDEELIDYLIMHGLGSGQAEEVIRAFWRVRRLGRWYEYEGEDVSEHETRTFLVVPLLLALGWPEQRLKIEWKQLDIAFFKSNYSPDANPMMILESKRLDRPLFGAEKQAKNYSKKFPHCNKLVVSNGIRYLLFVKKKNEWLPKAYLNLLKLRTRHPYYVEIYGAPELLAQLLP